MCYTTLKWMTDWPTRERILAANPKETPGCQRPARLPVEPPRGRATYKLAAGDYRAEIEWDRDRGELRLLQVGHRDKFYE